MRDVKRILQIFFCLFVMLGTYAPVHAALQVTEIMYNPPGSNTGHQWVEVTNTGDDSVDLSRKDIRFFDSKGNHLLKPYGAGNMILTPGDVAVISQNPLTFLSDFSTYTGILIKSSFTLTSSGIVGINQNDGTILSKAAYTSSLGAAGDGNSLQVAQGTDAFKPAAPTPGIFPLTLPAKIIPPTKPVETKTSSKKRAAHTSTARTHNSSNTYGKGTDAPPASADAEAGGALSSFHFPSSPLPNLPVFSSPWFAAFLGLLAFFSFSLILIQRTTNL
jgi:hypothetical protein